MPEILIEIRCTPDAQIHITPTEFGIIFIRITGFRNPIQCFLLFFDRRHLIQHTNQLIRLLIDLTLLCLSQDHFFYLRLPNGIRLCVVIIDGFLHRTFLMKLLHQLFDRVIIRLIFPILFMINIKQEIVRLCTGCLSFIGNQDKTSFVRPDVNRPVTLTAGFLILILVFIQPREDVLPRGQRQVFKQIEIKSDLCRLVELLLGERDRLRLRINRCFNIRLRFGRRYG